MTNSVELLLDLGVDTAQSQRNVERAINNIKTQLREQLNVDININTNGGSGSRVFRDVARNSSQANDSLREFNETTQRTASGSRALETALYRTDEALKRVARDGSVSGETLEMFSERVRGVQNSSARTSDKIYDLTIATRELNSEFRESANANRLERQFNTATQASERLNSQLARVRASFSGLVNPQDLSRLQNQINSLEPPSFGNQDDVRRYNAEVQRLSTSIRSLGEGASIASRQNQGFLDSFERSLKTFPAFVAASTILYGTLELIGDLTRQVVELDTALVSLQRVLDAPSYEFNTVIAEASVLTRELSGELNGFLGSLEEFARQGFSLSESLDLAETTTLLTNISDLKADESIDALIAAQKAFNITAEDSIQIADKLNEVDNNYAVTTGTLAESLNRAAATATTFGVTLDELIGNTTAIGEVTRESGSIIGNSLRTIYARITNNRSAITALNEIGISVTDVEGNARSATDILEELAGEWDSLSEAQRRNTAIGVAGIYQLNRFNALLLNYNQSVNATETAVNSAGSAQREQNIFNESLEARLNRLSTAWSELASVIGNEVIYDAIVNVTSAAEGLIGVTNSLSGGIGAFPVVFGILGTLAVSLTNYFKGARIAVSATTATILSLVPATTAATTGFRALGVAIRFATAIGPFALVTAALTLVGAAISKISSITAEATQRTERFENAQRANVDALTVNKEATTALIAEYRELSSAEGEAQRARDPEAEQRYVDLQNRLAEIYPALIAYTTANGDARLKSVEAIDSEIASTTKLIEAERELARAKAVETVADNGEEIGDLRESSDRYGRVVDNLTRQLEQGKNVEDRLNKYRQKLAEVNFAIAELGQEVNGNVIDIVNSFGELGTIDPNIADSVAQVISNLDFEEVDPDDISNIAEEIGRLQQELSEAVEAGDKDAFNALREEFTELVEPIAKINENLDLTIPTFGEAKDVAEQYSDSIGGVGDANGEAGESFGGLEEEILNTITAFQEYNGIVEQVAGISSKGLEVTDDLLFAYNILTARIGELTQAQYNELISKGQLTAAEQNVVNSYREREGIIQQLVAVYPHLATQINGHITLTKQSTQAIQAERDANGVLLESYENVRKGAYNSEQQRTLISAENTRARIKFLENEIRALELYTRAAVKATESFNPNMSTTGNRNDPELIAFYERQQNVIKSAPANLKAYTDELASLRASLNTNVSSLKSYNTALSSSGRSSSGAGKSTASASKETAKATEVIRTAKFVNDQYAESLDNISLELERQQNLRETSYEGAQDYNKSLVTTRNLEQQRLDILEKQRVALTASINAGRPPTEYGLIDTTPNGDKVSASVAEANRQKALAEARSDLLQLREEIIGQRTAILQLETEIFKSNNATFDIRREDLAYEIERLTSAQNLYTEGTKEFEDLTRERIVLQQRESGLILEQRRAVQQSIGSRKLSNEGLREANQLLRELTIAYYESLDVEKQLEDEIFNSQEQRANDLADTIIETYKKAITERRNDFNRQNDLEKKKEAELNAQRLKQINQQREAFRASVQERIDLLDEEEANRSYEENVEGLNEQRNDLQARADLLLLDNSQGATAQRADLLGQIEDIDKQLEDTRRQRNLELQKESYNDLIEQNEEEASEAERFEDERYSLVVKRLDDEREYYNQYFDDLLNDERAFAQMREDIVRGNLSNIQAQFQQLALDLTSTLPELENTLNGTMEAVGTAIRQNVIDELNNALGLLNEFKQQSESATSAINTGGKSSAGFTNADYQVLLAKYINENVVSKQTSTAKKNEARFIGDEIAARGRAQGSTIRADKTLQSYLDQLTPAQKAELGQYIADNAGVLTDSTQSSYLADLGRNLVAKNSTSSGLVTNPNKFTQGNNLSIPSPNSQVLQPPSYQISATNLESPATLQAKQEGNVIFQVANMNATEAEARSFASRIDTIRKTAFGGN